MIQVQDVILQMGDRVGNASVGQATTEQKIRAIDSAVNYLRRRIGLPTYERKFEFQFASDVPYNDCPDDFQESLALVYDDANNNTPANFWDYRPYRELLTKTGVWPASNKWAHLTANTGSHQLLLLGNNIKQGSTIETFDNTLWTASGDASGIALDTITKVQGSASQKFTITHNTGVSTLTSPAVGFDFRALHENRGVFRYYPFIPTTTGLTNLQIRYQSSTGNYYTITATTTANGEAFSANEFNFVSFPTASAVATGSPNLASINQIQIIWNTAVGFGTQASCRVDWLYTIVPDDMNLIYLTKYKGQNSTGTEITTLTAVDDEINLDDDYIEPIAIKAAMYLWPQLQGDLNFMQMYQSEFMDVMRAWARQWPKSRLENNFSRTQLRR